MEKFMEIIATILTLTAPAIKQLIQSAVVPFLKRRMYERVDSKVDKLISDLAQNASKIKGEKDENKKFAYIEASKLGVETLRKIAEKLNKASDEIEKVL